MGQYLVNGKIFFKMQKIVARNLINNRSLHFLGKDIAKTNKEELLEMICKKLGQPLDAIEICDPKGNGLKQEDALKDIF